MTSWIAASARGGARSAEIAKAHPLRNAVSIRLELLAARGVGRGRWPYWQVIGDCGHVLKQWFAPTVFPLEADDADSFKVRPLGDKDFYLNRNGKPRRYRCRYCQNHAIDA